MPPEAGGAALKLRAEDADDLAVISACLQDALVSVRDLAYDREAGTFILVANRFRWEYFGAGNGGVAAPFERTLCAIGFEAIRSVAYRGFRRIEEERLLALLAIRTTPGPAGAGAMIDLEFAGSATIRLSAAAICCRVRDLGEPWPTVWRPGHDELEPPP
jgi:hypothetical protein